MTGPFIYNHRPFFLARSKGACWRPVGGFIFRCVHGDRVVSKLALKKKKLWCTCKNGKIKKRGIRTLGWYLSAVNPHALSPPKSLIHARTHRLHPPPHSIFQRSGSRDWREWVVDHSWGVAKDRWGCGRWDLLLELCTDFAPQPIKAPGGSTYRTCVRACVFSVRLPSISISAVMITPNEGPVSASRTSRTKMNHHFSLLQHLLLSVVRRHRGLDRWENGRVNNPFRMQQRLSRLRWPARWVSPPPPNLVVEPRRRSLSLLDLCDLNC